MLSSSAPSAGPSGGGGPTVSTLAQSHRRQTSSVNSIPPEPPQRPPLTSTSSSTTNGNDLVHQGWLTKSPPPRGIFKPRWRRRWFILKAGLFPNQFVLEYFTDATCRRKKGRIDLDECEQISGGPIPAQDRHKFTFYLRTPGRTYYLASDSEEEMTKWVTCICQACGLKATKEVETEMYTKPSDENNHPQGMEEQRERSQASDEHSPTLSTVSSASAYIPISECFTGKPILFNDNNGKDALYWNTSGTSFPFPPKVNWATHPGKKDASSDNSSLPTPSPSSAFSNSNNHAPPRPPKKSSGSRVPDIAITLPEPSPNNNVSNTNKKVHQTQSFLGSVFRYDETGDENHDTSSISSSSLQSPPGSAGALYGNLPHLTETKGGVSPIYQNPPAIASPAAQSSQINPIPSPAESSSTETPPPRVNRKLKPEVNKPLVSPLPKLLPSSSKHSSGAMTLPSRNNYRQVSHNPGPVIDRSRKPPESPITLGPTPAQVKNQVSAPSAAKHQTGGNKTSTLPASPRRRTGPTMSPHGHDQRLPVHHEYDQPEDLVGTYLQIDCKASGHGAKESGSGGGDANKTRKIHIHKKSNSTPKDDGSVEYRLIDHVKTEALNKMIQEREEQLVRTNPISLKSFN